MRFIERKLRGTFEIVFEPKEDSRGFFVRTYELDEFAKRGLARGWVQENTSVSRERGVIRGLHFQHPPHAEGKLMSLASGTAFLAWVDLRAGSPTFGEWDSIELSAGRGAIYTPRGFANGMCTLSGGCALLYKMDNRFHPESQDAIRWDDPDIGIAWPIDRPTALSDRDRSAKSFAEFRAKFGGLAIEG